jgi:hypothetical protein
MLARLRKLRRALILKALGAANTSEQRIPIRRAEHEIPPPRLATKSIRRAAMSTQAANKALTGSVEDILELARAAGLLITLDGQIGREKYQSVAGSLSSFLRFVNALRDTDQN